MEDPGDLRMRFDVVVGLRILCGHRPPRDPLLETPGPGIPQGEDIEARAAERGRGRRFLEYICPWRYLHERRHPERPARGQ